MTATDKTLPGRALAWAANAVHPEAVVLSVEQLHGGVSSLVHGISMKVHGDERNVVLRLFTDSDWLKEQPDLVAREAASLRRASRIAGAATPELVACDETGAGTGAPAVLMTRLSGSVMLEPPDMARWLDGMAEAAARIHKDEPGDFPWAFVPYVNASSLDTSSWSSVPDRWRTAARIVADNRPAFTKRFIHRDFHPANVLWTDGRLSGVVDWVNGCIGPAGVDVGHCRVNLALLHGVEAADEFLSAYTGHAGNSFAYDPYWDLVTLIDFSDGPPEVYEGWTALGMKGLTDRMMGERLDRYLLSVLKRF